MEGAVTLPIFNVKANAGRMETSCGVVLQMLAEFGFSGWIQTMKVGPHDSFWHFGFSAGGVGKPTTGHFIPRVQFIWPVWVQVSGNTVHSLGYVAVKKGVLWCRSGRTSISKEMQQGYDLQHMAFNLWLITYCVLPMAYNLWNIISGGEVRGLCQTKPT